MVFNKSNIHLLNTSEVSVHDDYFLGLSYDTDTRTLILKLEKYIQKTPYQMRFSDVLSVDMIACGFWGGSQRDILELWYAEKSEQVLIPRLYEESSNPSYVFVKNLEDYIEFVLRSCSGDTIRIVCKELDIYE